MVANPERRAAVADAAISVLGDEGARALTHRAVDAHAGVPVGTSSNYFPSRSALLAGVAERIFELVGPDRARLATMEALSVDEAFGEYVSYVVERLLGRPELGRALIELRLESSRVRDLEDRVGGFLRSGLVADVEFHRGRGLPGGRALIVAAHHVVNGVLLDALTVSVDPDADPVAAAKKLATTLAQGLAVDTSGPHGES